MKNYFSRQSILLLLLIFVVTGSFKIIPVTDDAITGAWYSKASGQEDIVTCIDGYFVHSTYDKAGKKFMGTWGGTYTLKNDQFQIQTEFNSLQKEKVGELVSLPFSVNGNKLKITVGGRTLELQQVDNGTGELAGAWQITGRMRNEQLVTMPAGPRKTMKILSGTRFQWIAMNTATKEFSGTGGGTYTFTNGTYTENIEFFSRDSSRVGASLSFEGKVANNLWEHKGQSSTGNLVNEVWKRIYK